jgi:hypothetical protein
MDWMDRTNCSLIGSAARPGVLVGRSEGTMRLSLKHPPAMLADGCKAAIRDRDGEVQRRTRREVTILRPSTTLEPSKAAALLATVGLNS